MRMEMEGREPLIVLFGVPFLTTVIVLVSMYLGQLRAAAVPPPNVQVQPNITVTPRVVAELPADGIRTNITVPPAQIHEVIREVVKVPEVSVINRVEPTPPPAVQVNLPRVEPQSSKVVVIPAPMPMLVPTPVSTDAAEGAEGKLLPPPKDVGGLTEPR
jgi:hypothetical protein